MDLFVRIIVAVLVTVATGLVSVTAISSLDDSLLSDIISIFILIASIFLVRVAYGALMGKYFDKYEGERERRDRG
jgi:predicted membrane-bound spermidine synthase